MNRASVIKRMALLIRQVMESGISDDGYLNVTLDDNHALGWDMEGTCADCFFYMGAISALPELAKLTITSLSSRDSTVKSAAEEVIAKMERNI